MVTTNENHSTVYSFLFKVKSQIFNFAKTFAYVISCNLKLFSSNKSAWIVLYVVKLRWNISRTQFMANV